MKIGISLLSIRRVVFLCGLALAGVVFFAAPSKAAAARYYFSPSSGSYSVGATVTATVVIDSGGQAINSGEGSVSFSSDKLQFQSVSTSGSIFTFWTSGPTGSATSVSFGGGLSNPGYTGVGGRVLTVTWKAIAAGTATVSISGGKILANDGYGTNVYSGASGASFAIGAKATPVPTKSVTIRSSTHGDGQWTNNKKAEFTWSASIPVKGYYFAFDQSPGTSPAGTLTTKTSHTQDSIADGTWYFHVRASHATETIPVAHYKVLVDTVAPEEFTVTVDTGASETNPTPTLRFEAKDATSGIEKYEASIDGGAAFAIKSGDTLPKLSPGNHTIIIKAFDKAGNTRDSQATYKIVGIAPPKILDWTARVAILKPITFTGQSSETDTIVVYLNGKEVHRFVAKDLKIDQSPTGDDTAGQIVWKYTYGESLFPNNYEFTFRRIDSAGAESEPTKGYEVNVLGSVVTIGGFVLPAMYVVIGMLIFILILIILLLFFFVRLRRRIRDGGGTVGSMAAALKRVLSRTEHEIIHDIEVTVPNSQSSSGVMREVKKDLKEKVKHTIEDEEKSL